MKARKETSRWKKDQRAKNTATRGKVTKAMAALGDMTNGANASRHGPLEGRARKAHARKRTQIIDHLRNKRMPTADEAEGPKQHREAKKKGSLLCTMVNQPSLPPMIQAERLQSCGRHMGMGQQCHLHHSLWSIGSTK